MGDVMGLVLGALDEYGGQVLAVADHWHSIGDRQHVTAESGIILVSRLVFSSNHGRHRHRQVTIANC